jgi:hypothetical protein
MPISLINARGKKGLMKHLKYQSRKGYKSIIDFTFPKKGNKSCAQTIQCKNFDRYRLVYHTHFQKSKKKIK